MLPLSGVALEGFVGATQFTGEEGALAAQEPGLGYSFGLSLAIDAELVRSSNLGMGLAGVYTQLPEDAAGERPDSFGFAAQYWLTGASELGSDELRLRGHMGLLFGQGNTGLLEAYTGGGASYHPRRGFSVHVFAGPHWLAVREPDTGTTYYGLGAFARIRLRQAIFLPCDEPPSAYGGQIPREITCSR